VEPVEWLYDGLRGKIIPWTKANGGHSDDPSAQVFLVGRNGKVFARCPGAQAYSASGLSKWLAAQIVAYAKRYPRTALAFQEAEITLEQNRPRCEALDAARRVGKPILLYVGREATPRDDRKAKAQVKAVRKFEKGTLSSKRAAAAAKGWTLLRLDISKPAHAALARGFGVKQAPTLLLWAPAMEKPRDLGKLQPASLAYNLKKSGPR